MDPMIKATNRASEPTGACETLPLRICESSTRRFSMDAHGEGRLGAVTAVQVVRQAASADVGRATHHLLAFIECVSLVSVL